MYLKYVQDFIPAATNGELPLECRHPTPSLLHYSLKCLLLSYSGVTPVYFFEFSSSLTLNAHYSSDLVALFIPSIPQFI